MKRISIAIASIMVIGMCLTACQNQEAEVKPEGEVKTAPGGKAGDSNRGPGASIDR